jgi:hypothetical protein
MDSQSPVTKLVDEETPLLVKEKPRTPLPWLQISIVLLLQMCEPITSQSIYPYISQVLPIETFYHDRTVDSSSASL